MQSFTKIKNKRSVKLWKNSCGAISKLMRHLDDSLWTDRFQPKRPVSLFPFCCNLHMLTMTLTIKEGLVIHKQKLQQVREWFQRTFSGAQVPFSIDNLN